MTAIFLHLSQQKKQIKKKLQTLPQFQHQRRKSCQSSWSGGISKLERKLETRIWNNDPGLPRQPNHFHQKNFTISTIAKSKINTKKKLINKLKARNQLLRKPSRTVVSNRATPAIEVHNGPASSAKLSSETELDTLSVTSRHNHQTPENGQKSHFRRYSQFQPNTKRSQEENGGSGGGEPQSIKLGTDGSPLTGDKLGLQEESPFLRRPSRTVTETLAVVGSKEDFSPKVISIFGQNMQTPRQSGLIYSFQEGLDEKIEEDNTSQKPHVKPAIILKKDESNKNSKPQSPAFNQEDVVKELTNLKKDMKKVKGYLKHAKKRSFKKSKMTKSKVLQQQPQPPEIVVQTEPTAEIVITEPQEGPKTARSRRELTRIIATPKANSNSVTKVKNIYNNSLNFGLDLKWIDPKSSLPFKETSRSPLTSLSKEPKSTQLTTTKIGSPYLMPSNPSFNSQSVLSIQKNEKSSIVNSKALQDVVGAQKGFTERIKEEKKSSINTQSGGLPQITKPRPKIQIKAWDEGIMERKNIPSGINSCSSRTISSMLANSKIIL